MVKFELFSKIITLEIDLEIMISTPSASKVTITSLIKYHLYAEKKRGTPSIEYLKWLTE